MDEREFYAGFSPEEQERHEAFIVERYEDGAERIAQGRRLRDAHGSDRHDEFMRELAEIEGELKGHHARDLGPRDAALAPVMARHHAWVGKAWNAVPPAQAYAGLGELYAIHPGFVSRFDRLSPGIADWLREAMAHYAETALSDR